MCQKEDEAVRTDMKRIVIARETVDQSLFGQCLVFDDPSGAQPRGTETCCGGDAML